MGALGVYAGQAAKYRRHACRFLELPEPAVPGTAAFSRWAEGVCAAPLREGNRVAVLRNGDQIAPSMIDAIVDARRSVDMSNYILWTGPMARDFVDAPGQPRPARRHPTRRTRWRLGPRPQAGEWIHQASLAIRARIPIEVLLDQVAQFPTYSEGYLEALESLGL